MGAPACASPALRRADGKPAWRPDGASASCLCCGQQFSMFVRRHHCRACGELVCAACSPHLGALPELGYADPVRVCQRCHKPSEAAAASPEPESNALLLLAESSSDGEGEDVEEQVVFQAVEVIALNSRDKRDKLMYQYFLKSEAVSWLADAGLARNRSRCAALFGRVVSAGYVTLKPAVNGSASARAAFYILSDEVCLDRVSQYGTAIHSDTVKCSNCARAFLKSMTSTPGFCSIDCKTNALISQADSAKIRRYYTS